MRSYSTLLSLIVAALLSLTLVAADQHGPRRLDHHHDRRLLKEVGGIVHEASTRAQSGLSSVLQKLGLPQIGPDPNTMTPVLAPQAFDLPTVVQRGTTAFQQMILNVNYRIAALGPQPVAKTKVGTFHGVNSPAIFNQQWWLGVPFAKPPVGNLRFRKAQTLDPTTADFNATAIRPTCWQPNGYLLSFNGDDGQRSEDCLYMNIYAPHGSENRRNKLPVLLWYFGGGEIGGAASSYNSTAIELLSILAGQPMIIVTPQYRLNAMGFMAGKPYADAAKAGKVDLNPGLTDVTKALDWVSEHISAFGGDPKKITIAGQSSGAFNVGAQLLKDGKPGSPPPKYRAAIMLSGTMGSEPAFKPDGPITTKTFNRISSAVGCGNDIECLRKASPMALAEATFPNLRDGKRPDDATLQGPDYYPGVFYYQPVQDGIYHRDGAGAQVRRGEFPDVPILTGNVKDEGTIFVDQHTSAADWQSWIAKVAFENQKTTPASQQSLLNKISAAYSPNVFDGAPYWPARSSNESRFGAGSQFERSASISGDQGWHAPRRILLESINKYKSSKAFVYLFNQTDSPPDVNGWTGIPHGFDPAYWFGAYAFSPNFAYPQQPATSRDTSLSMINFVNKMDPNHLGMKYWPAYDQQTKKVFRFQGFNNQIITDDFRPEMKVFMDPAALKLTWK